ncbi:hypothetical protein SUGI_1151470 [Cryptomeria japonica]|nr:hypothetical protein SUGI_1151470 [Cryptomeria japonica]
MLLTLTYALTSFDAARGGEILFIDARERPITLPLHSMWHDWYTGQRGDAPPFIFNLPSLYLQPTPRLFFVCTGTPAGWQGVLPPGVLPPAHYPPHNALNLLFRTLQVVGEDPLLPRYPTPPLMRALMERGVVGKISPHQPTMYYELPNYHAGQGKYHSFPSSVSTSKGQYRILKS